MNLVININMCEQLKSWHNSPYLVAKLHSFREVGAERVLKSSGVKVY